MKIKGRSGEIKLNFNNTIDVYVPYEDVKFLIKQTERVHELEQQNKRYKQTLENMQREIHKVAYEQAKRYKQALEHIQREIHKAIYTPKKQKYSSDFEREFERGKTRGLIQASDIVKEVIEKMEGEE